MKKSIAFFMILACGFAMGQNINDVLRYSLEDLNGTARFQAMSGAFGALGGDLSALNANPAGSAIFGFGQFTATGANYHRGNDSHFESSSSSSNLNSTELNQIGTVFVFKSNDSPWKKLALAINYDLTQNFDNEFRAAGRSSIGIDQYFLNYADGAPFRLLQSNGFIEDDYLNLAFADQQAFLGYQAGIISPSTTDEDNTTYFSNAEYELVNQNYSQATNGYNSKFTLNFAGQYEKNLYLGASMNFHSVLYERLTLFSEDGYNSASRIQNMVFDNFLFTEGNGFSFSLGAIAKVNDNVRFGASYQSPTWYRLTDDLSQRIRTNAPESNQLSRIDFNLVNLYPQYRIRTPSKLTASTALIFGKKGLLSFDYSYQNFANAKLRPDDNPAFDEENSFIAQQLTAVNSFRLGGEYRIKSFSIRGGYRYEQSPYENAVQMGDLQGFSTGLGYSFGPNRFDLGFSRTERDVNELFFDSGVIPNAAEINQVLTNISLSYSLKF